MPTVTYNPFIRNYDFMLSPNHTHGAIVTDWAESVLSKTVSYGGAVASGTNRYIAPTTSGSWTEDNIYQWNGSDWDETTVSGNEGVAVFVEDSEKIYVYSNGAWILLGSFIDHGNLQGLGDDDHPQYLKDVVEDATPQLGGDLDTNGHAILFGSDTISGTGDIYCGDLHTNSGSLYLGNLHLTYNGSHLIVPEQLQVTGDIGTDADLYINGTIYGDGSNLDNIDHDSLDGFVADEHINWTNASQDFKTSGNVYCGSMLRTTVTTKCQVRFVNDNTVEFYCGNKTYMIMNAYGDLVLNEGGYNNNGLRVESDTNTNMLKVNAATNRVGIGTGSPAYTLDVAGEVRAQTNYRSADGTEGASGWYDDGENFRVTVKNGLITDIGPTVSGGYSMS